MTTLFWVVTSFVAGGMCLLLALYVWRKRVVPDALLFACFLLALALWTVGYGLELQSPELAGKLLWARVQYVGIVLVPVFWFAFLLRYATAKRLGWVSGGALCVVPLITLLLAWTSDRHGLLWRAVRLEPYGDLTLFAADYGPWFWIHTAYSYALLLLGAGLLIGALTLMRPLYRWQSLSLLTGALLPWAVNIAYVALPGLAIDPTPFSLGLGALVMAVGFSYFRAPDPLPGARALVLEAMDDAVVVLNAYDVVLDLNQAARTLFGLDPEHALGQPVATLLLAWPELGAWLQRATLDPEEVTMSRTDEVRHLSARLSPLHDERGRFAGRVLIVQDITLRKAQQLVVERMAYTDALTGLANRLSLSELGGRLLALAEREGRELALFYMDLNRFKMVNDTLGHDVGDDLLTHVAARLRHVTRDSDLLARLGGDEFALLSVGLNRKSATELASRMLGELRRPFLLAGQTLHIGASLGIALYPHDGTTMLELLKRADMAMYQVKRGQSSSPFYDPERGRHDEQQILETALRQALEASDLSLHYQPIFDLRAGQMVGHEALLRWVHAGTPVPPARFIPLAEDAGLIREIDGWVCHQVVHHMLEHPRQPPQLLPPPQPLWTAVNLSPQSFRDHQLLDRLSALADHPGFSAGRVMLEITENALMDVEPALATLTQLKRLGFLIALDDFGTSYSSLAYIERFPLDVLKIDQAFVAGVCDNPAKAAIARTIITLGHNLGMRVLAEGVETRAQRAWLEHEGCDLAQGYLLGRPEPWQVQRALVHP